MINRPPLPFWMRKIFGDTGFIFIEESTVDPINRVMVLKGKNLTFGNIISTEETCTYSVDPQNSNWTLFKQEFKVHAFPFGVSGPIENYSVQRFLENAEKGRAVMDQAIQRIQTEYAQFLSYSSI